LEAKHSTIDVLHATGYDVYALNATSAHPSGGYIVYNALKKSKFSSLMAVTIERRVNDDSTFLYPYGQHHPQEIKTPEEVAKGLPPHKVLVVYGEEFSPEQLKAIHLEHGCTIVMVMMTHDILTGGCAYPRTPNYKEGDIRKLSCDGHKKSCGSCPELALPEPNPKDKTFKLFQRKKENLKDLPIILAGVSSYSLSVAKENSIFKDMRKELLPILHDVPYASDTRSNVRKQIQLPADKQIILWGTTQPENLRKGRALADEVFNYLWEMMSNEERQNTEILCAGPLPEPGFHETQKFHVNYSGYLPSREHMALMYKAANVSLCTTVSDAGPMMVTESLTNECPVVGFDRSVILDLVTNGKNGHIVENLDTRIMAEKTLEILRSPDREKMSQSSREAALIYHDPKIIIDKWDSIFEEAINK
jgi:hypothetical protein